MDAFSSLPPLNVNSSNDYLPSIPIAFFMPKLADAPQNPIMDTLRLAQELKAFNARSASSKLPDLTHRKEPELTLDYIWDDSVNSREESEAGDRDMWRMAAKAAPMQVGHVSAIASA